MKVDRVAPMLTCMVLLLGSCISPGTLSKVADQNRTNIANLTANVAALMQEARSAAELRISLQVNQARNMVFAALGKVETAGIAAGMGETVLMDSSKSWNTEWDTTQKPQLDELARKLAGVSTENEEALEGLTDRYPVLLDVYTQEQSRVTVLRDAFEEEQLNQRILSETDAGIKAILIRKRNRIADRYRVAKAAIRMGDEYRSAMSAFEGVLNEQSAVARQHAEAVAAFADSKPALESLTATFKNPDLRSSLLGIVERKRGTAAKNKLSGSLSKIDSAIESMQNKN